MVIILDKKILQTDLLVIGGGAAGTFAAIKAKQNNNDIETLVIDKGNIERSGCLASGINAINAYITENESPYSYLEYVKKDNYNLIRDDLVLSIGKNVNKVTKTLEKWGLPIKKDKQGNYLARSSRSIKIKGENIKPILANKLKEHKVKIMNRTLALNFIIEENTIKGVYAYNITNNIFYKINAEATIIATGGAAGIYQPNNMGKARHKMWYPPFNSGSGYAMGIRAGAEMTTFEMRFIALRVKDVFAPTGTLAFAGARQVNNLGEEYLNKYDNITTAMRLYATIQEEKEGRGPCFMVFDDISKKKKENLYKSFLNMSPDLILKFEEEYVNDNKIKIPITGSEPFIVGGHAQAGYWIDVERKTTLNGLYAAGDVAGGAPKKYASGAFVEGKIAAEAAVEYIKNNRGNKNNNDFTLKDKKQYNNFIKFVKKKENYYIPEELLLELQFIMEKYAGGKSKNYELNEKDLKTAKNKISNLDQKINNIYAKNKYELIKTIELVNKIEVAKVLIEHLLYRQETRWPGYQTRMDYPYKNDDWLKFINSKKDLEKDELILKTIDLKNTKEVIV